MKQVRILNLEPAEEDSRRVRAALEKTFDIVWHRVADERGFRASLSSEEWDVVMSSDEAVCLTGVEAYEIVVDEGHDIPFIILADAVDQDAAVAAMRLGVSDYLAKDDLVRLVLAVARELYEAENRREHKAAEKALAESEDRLRLALRAGGIGAWEWDLKTNDAVWSPETSVIIGIPVAGSEASVFRDLVFPADLPVVENARRIAVETCRSFDVRFRIRRRGDVRWVAASGKCEFDDAGEPAKLVGTVRDITRDKEAEDALRRSERDFRALVQASTHFVWQFDESGAPYGRQEWWEKLTGQPFEESLNFGWLDCVHSGDRERVRAVYTESLASGTPIEAEMRIRERSGEYRHYAASGVPVADPEGNRWICALKDIHDQRSVEQRYRVVSTISSDYVFSGRVSENGDIVLDWLTGAFERITGYEVDEFNNLGGWRAIVHPDDRETDRRDFAKLLRNESVETEIRIVEKSGETVWVRVCAQPIWDQRRNRLAGLYGAVQDITERKSAELAVRGHEAYLQSVLNAEPECVKVFGRAGEILDINPAGLAILEADSEEEVLGKPDLGVIREADAEQFAQALDRVWSGETVTVGYRMIGFKGTKRCMEMRAAPIRDAEGNITSVLGVSRDITEKHRIEAALMASEKQYADLINTVDGIVWEANAETFQTTFVSNRAETILGYPVKRWFEKNFWQELLHPDDHDMVLAHASQKAAKGEGHTLEYRMRAADGRVVWVRDFVNVVVEPGRPTMLRGLMVDVTEQRRRDAAMKQQAVLIEQANEAIFVWDLDRGVIEWNRGCEKLYGYEREDVFGKFAYDVLRTKLPDGVAAFREALATDGAWSGEMTQTTRSGEIVLVDSRAQLIELDGRKVVLQASRNITEQRKAEAALLASEEQLRQSQKLESIGILAGGLAHDFNNMLTAINGYSDLILRRVEAEDPVRKHVVEIKKAGERSAELTRQLLAFSRRQILQPTTLDLNGAIADTASMLKRLIGEDIAVTTKLAPDLGKIQADQGQLAQVLMNLLINARDAMPNGGSVVIETANVELDRDYAGLHVNVTPGPYVMLAISDTGVGMDEQTRLRVFEPFFTTKPVGRGTGLGLSTVYGIVKQSGGNIWVYSEPGKGSTFKIYLPQANAAAAGTARHGAEQPALHVGSERILLVEDEDSVRGLARQILEACGYEVFEAANGAEAFTKFEADLPPVDLLITDIVMPEMGGRELSEKVLRQRPATKVLFTSGYTDDAIVRHGIIDEGKNFLQKPFTFDGLARKVRLVLDGATTGPLKGRNN